MKENEKQREGVVEGGKLVGCEMSRVTPSRVIIGRKKFRLSRSGLATVVAVSRDKRRLLQNIYISIRELSPSIDVRNRISDFEMKENAIFSYSGRELSATHD